MNEDIKRIAYSPGRAAFYLFAVIWLFLLPEFDRNASHFGWGFMPVIASIIVVPAILGGLLIDLIIRINQAFKLRDFSLGSRVISAIVPGAMIIGSIVWLYFLFTK